MIWEKVELQDGKSKIYISFRLTKKYLVNPIDSIQIVFGSGIKVLKI